jgi:hypothetical protein
MSIRLRFNTATITGIVLAKVGNPQREEPLQTSREVFRVDEADRDTLTALFLKPFKNLVAHRFFHHASLDMHEMNQCVSAIFAAPGSLLNRGIEIAQRLYAKSNHPNIKSGDLCVALMDDMEIEGQMTQGLCILKSESVVPFLSISAEDGDLRLHTEQGINPDKIDKGCLILNFWPNKGYYVLTFDRSGSDARFWVREFLGLQAVPDAAFLTNTYAEIAVKAVKHDLDETITPEESSAAAREVIAYFDERENFDLAEFEEKVLRTPDAVARFNDQRTKIEEDHGEPLDTNFEIEPKEVKKVRKQASAVLKLDTGVEIHIKPTPEQEPVIERGYDDDKRMKFIKVFFNEVES